MTDTLANSIPSADVTTCDAIIPAPDITDDHDYYEKLSERGGRDNECYVSKQLQSRYFRIEFKEERSYIVRDYKISLDHNVIKLGRRLYVCYDGKVQERYILIGDDQPHRQCFVDEPMVK